MGENKHVRELREIATEMRRSAKALGDALCKCTTSQETDHLSEAIAGNLRFAQIAEDAAGFISEQIEGTTK